MAGSKVSRTMQGLKWTVIRNATATTTAVPVAVTQGKEVDQERRGEFIHIVALKTNTCTLRIWGLIKVAGEGEFEATINQWVLIQTITFTGTTNEAYPLQAAGQFDRIAAQVTALGGGTVRVLMGEGC